MNTVGEFAAVLLQGAITLGLALLCVYLYTRYRRPWFAWFAAAWGMYVLRLVCIASFLATDEYAWLYWHQVTTGWTALTLLWASLVFSRQLRARPWHALALLFPPAWSYIAIYQLDVFLAAALPSVVFLSLATLWTGIVFWRYHRVAASPGARLLAIAFSLWALHHLDYPFLRAQGAWNPWGYYLDIAFELLVGVGVVMLVLDDLGRGVRALTTLSGDLQRRQGPELLLDTLVRKALTLPGVIGSAIYARGTFTHCSGGCSTWEQRVPDSEIVQALQRVDATHMLQVAPATDTHAYITALPVMRGGMVVATLVMESSVRNPFTALDNDFLLALGQQVGVALEQASLDAEISARTRELEHLSAQMVRQHEDERRRLSRELHDETAQVFSAVKMQLDDLRRVVPASHATRVDRLSQLVDTGIRSIRNVTHDLRPSLLDDLGLLPALRSLVAEFRDRTGLRITLDAPEQVPPLAADTELALFRALQEALSNVVRHAQAHTVTVTVTARSATLTLHVRDDGRGLPRDPNGVPTIPTGRMGITGMRERLLAVGGTLELQAAHPGTALQITVPLQAVAHASLLVGAVPA